MCLVLGPSGVGKTLLLKRLQSSSAKGTFADFSEVPSTIPTIGTNLVSISCGRKNELMIRELGGVMAPIWATFYKDCSALIFVIDTSNRQQVSAASILLLEVLNSAALATIPTIIALNKGDVVGSMNRIELESIFRFNDVISHASQSIKVMECSALLGTGLQSVLQFVQTNTKPSAQTT